MKTNKKIFQTILAITVLLLTVSQRLNAQSNTAFGFSAFAAGGGVHNSAFGYYALNANASGGGNTAVGSGALQSNNGGNYNTAVGYLSLLFNTTGTYNTAIGHYTLHDNNTGSHNVAIGSWVLPFNKGSLNVASGDYALTYNTTGSENTGMGHGALVNNTTGSNNVAVGRDALLTNLTGVYNTGLGYGVDVASGNLTNATAIGYGARVAASNTIQLGNSGVTEVYAGVGNKATLVAGNVQALGGKISTTSGVALTLEVNNQKAGLVDHTLFNTSYGYQSLYSNTTGSENTASGSNALYSNTTGVGNTASGSNALYSNTEGFDNTASGFFALRRNTKGYGNTASGSSALVSNTEGSNNTAIGTSALYNNITGPNNVANGYRALYSNTTGGYNTASGYQALNANTTGDGNIAIGDRSLLANTTGSYNTAVGSLALSTGTKGKYNTAVGYNANIADKDAAGKDITNATAIGAGAVVNASNKIRLGDESITIIEGKVMFTPSDGRFKTGINEQEVKGLAFIKKLRPVVYNFDTRKFQSFLTQNMPADVRQKYMDKDFSASTAIRQSGFIAQEVEKAAEEVGYDFNGLHKPESANDNYSLAYSQFVVPLVKAVQELSQKDEQKNVLIEQQEKKIEAQQQINQQLQQQLKDQQQQIDELKQLMQGANTLATSKPSSESSSEELHLFPNPTTGVFTIVDNHTTNATIEVYDRLGNSVKKEMLANIKSGYKLDLSGYAKGTYWVNIISGNKKYTKQIVVQ